MLAVRRSTGEAVWIDLASRRAGPPSPPSRLEQTYEHYVMWFDLKANGYTLEEISKSVDVPMSTVAHGIRRAPAILRRAAARASDQRRARARLPELEPVFGVRPLTNASDLTPADPCPYCDDGRRIPIPDPAGERADACGHCWRSHPSVDSRLADQLAQLAVLEARVKANRRTVEHAEKLAAKALAESRRLAARQAAAARRTA